jgi:hypothetical protein
MRALFSFPVRRLVRTLTMLVVCGAATVVLAAGPDAVRTTRVVSGSGSTTITGSAWNADNTPIPGARLQLRDVVSGKIRGAALADEAGRFSFTNIEGGTYVVEMVDAGGKVVTIGHAFVIAPGETVATFVRLGNRVPWFSGFFNNAAGAVVSTASSQGIAAIAPVQLPESAPSSAK